MAFIETPRFPDDISYGSTGGPMWSTNVLIIKSGFEGRNANWSNSRYKYNAAMGVRDEGELDELIEWFNSMQGRTHGFRFKDWTDFSSYALGGTLDFQDQSLGTGDGLQLDYQIIKTYTKGTQSRTRDITKPISSTLKVGVNGVEVLGPGNWTLDSTTGIITFVVAPPAAHAVTAGYEFDVPVRFDTDELEISLDHYLTGSSSVPIVEIRQ